jgi:hypothetical protein
MLTSITSVHSNVMPESLGMNSLAGQPHLRSSCTQKKAKAAHPATNSDFEEETQ